MKNSKYLMTEVTIRNKVWHGRYEYVVVKIENKKYYLQKYNSEIKVDVYDKEFEVEYSVYWAKNIKKFKDLEKEKIFLEIRSNTKIIIPVIVFDFLLFMIGAVAMLIFQQVILLGIPLFLILLSNIFLMGKNSIEIVEKEW